MSENTPEKAESNPIGRPTLYKPEYCQQLIDHMAEGLSYEAFAGVIGVSKRVIYDWEKAHDEFLQAKEVAFDKSRVFWERLAIDNIINKSDSFGEGQSQSRSLNASVWIFNMKNRFGWRDKQPGEDAQVLINNTNTQNTEPRTVEEVDERIRLLREKHEGK